MKRSKVSGCRPNGNDLGMSGRIFGGKHLVVAFPDDQSILDDDRAEWTSLVLLDPLPSEFNRGLHEREVLAFPVSVMAFHVCETSRR